MKFLFIYSLKLKLDSTENDCEIVNDVIAAHAVTLVTSSSYWIGERWKCWRMNWRDTLTLQRKKPTEIWMTSFQCTEKKTNREKPVSGRAQKKTVFFFRWNKIIVDRRLNCSFVWANLLFWVSISRVLPASSFNWSSAMTWLSTEIVGE